MCYTEHLVTVEPSVKASAILESDRKTGLKTVRYFNLSHDQYKLLCSLMVSNGKDREFELIRAETRAHAKDLDPVGRKLAIEILNPVSSVLLLALESRLGINIDNDPN